MAGSSSGKENHFEGPLNNVGTVFQAAEIGAFNYYGSERHEAQVCERERHEAERCEKERREAELWEKCISALQQTSPYYDRLTLITFYDRDSENEWDSVLENRDFQDWKCEGEPQNSLVWVCSGANTGKTRLAVSVTQHLESHNLGSKDRVLYFFCKDETGRDTAASIIKGFIVLLYEKEPHLAKFLHDQSRIQEDLRFRDTQIEALWDIFTKMVDNSDAERIYCVIDGIDHCNGINEVQHFLHKLNRVFGRLSKQQSSGKYVDLVRTLSRTLTDSMFQSATPQKLRVMVLSRARDIIAEELRPFPKLPIDVNAEMENFIETKIRRVSTICAKNKDPSEARVEISKRILNSGPDQSFLFVGLVYERMERMTLSQLTNYEKTAPKTVEEFHCQTLGKIPPKQRPAVLAMLKWVAHAERPLTALQLTKAVKYSLSKSFSQKSLKKAVDVCYGLVTELIEENKRVIVLGQGVAELLFEGQSPLLEFKQLKEFVVEGSNVQSELANACVAYLQESANLVKSRRISLRKNDEIKKAADKVFFDKHPFLEYAMVNWTYHAKRGNLEHTKYEVPFFEDKSLRRRLWWESYWMSLGQTFAWKWTTPKNFSLLHLSAFFDIVPLAQYVSDKGQLKRLLGSEDYQGMKPINWATENSATGMVKFLLEHGDYDSETLCQAARTGDVPIILMLLENKSTGIYGSHSASPMSPPGSPSSPLQSVRKVTLRSLSDLYKTVEGTAKSKPTPMSPTDSGYGKAKSETPLHIAATCGHDEAVAAFLDAGADFNARTDGGWTPLHNAAWFGRAPVIDSLTSFGADPKMKTNDGLTSLHCAIKNSQAAIVKMLLDMKVVDVEIEDNFGITPFYMACKCHNMTLMELMHQNGAEIDPRTRIGWTPLMWATVTNAFNVAQWLISHGAQVNAVWSHSLDEVSDSIDLNSLDLAKMYNRDGIAKLLQDHGGMDNRSIASKSSLELPLPAVVEETYDLPVVPDIALSSLERADTGDSLLSGELDGSSEGEADTHSASDNNDDESQSRKASTNSFEQEPGKARQSSFNLHGLGISEGNERGMELQELVSPETQFWMEQSRVEPDAEEVDQSAVQQTNQPLSDTDINSNHDNSRQEGTSLEAEPETYFDTQVTDMKLDNTSTPAASSPGVGQVPLQPQSSTESSDMRKGSGSKSPIGLNNLFTRRTWKMGSIGKVKDGSTDDTDEFRSTSDECHKTTTVDHATVESIDEAIGGAKVSKADEGMFGMLKSKRGISWKKAKADAKTDLAANGDEKIEALNS